MNLLTFTDRMRNSLYRAFREHPLAMLSGMAGAISGICLNEFKSSSELFAKILLVLWLGIPLSIALDLIALSRSDLKAPARMLLRAMPIGLLGLAWLGLAPLHENLLVIRFALWGAAAHCLVAVAPFLGSLGRADRGDFDSEDLRGFNLLLFERVLIGGMFSNLLFAGIAFAIRACDPLFGLKAADRAYADLWFCMAGVFQTAYIVNGIPRRSSEWRNRSLHAALVFLPKYILLPLGLLYLAILYAYGAKAILSMEWPRGWASSLILVYAGVMLLTLLLLDKGRDAEGQRNHGRLTRALFGALAPLLILLFLAIGKRISEYGVTEQRYLVLVSAIWLTLITAAHLLKGRTMVIAIPFSLGAVALLISIGPWNVFEISDHSQAGALKSLLARTGRFKDGRLRLSKAPVDRTIENEVSDHVRWFEARKRTQVLRAWLAEPGEKCPDCVAAWKEWPGPNKFLSDLGMEYRPYSRYEKNERQIAYRAKGNPRLLDLSGFDQALVLDEPWRLKDSGAALVLGPDTLKLEYTSEQLRLGKGSDHAILDPASLIKRLRMLSASGARDEDMPEDSLYADMDYAGRRWHFRFRAVTFDTLAKPARIKYYSTGMLLIGK